MRKKIWRLAMKIEFIVKMRKDLELIWATFFLTNLETNVS